MKKLITGAVAALALLFGFASCSGDLHDDEKNPIDLSGGYYLVGSMTGSWTNNATTVVAFQETETAGSYDVPFSADAAEVAFAFIPTPGSWAGQIGGDKMVAGTLPSGAKFESKDNGNGGENGTISGLEADGKYKLTVTALDDGTLKIDCSSNVPPTPYYLDGMYLVGDVFKTSGKENAFNFSSENLLWGAITTEATGVVTYTKDIKAIATAGELGINDSTWNNKQLGKGVEITADATNATVLNGEAGNFKVKGLTVGEPYRVEISTTPEKVISVKIYKIAEVTLSFKITGLTEGASAWINGSVWDSSWPQGWPIKAWNSETDEKNVGTTAKYIAAHPAAVADSNGVATFESSWNTTFISKIGDTKNWECKVVYIDGGTDWDAVGVVVKDSGSNLKFEYEVTAGGAYTFVIDAANGWKISVE